MKTETTVPVFANRAPWNELVLRGKRQVKTINFNWKHRGPILLYTSLRVDDFAWYDYDKALKRVKVADIPQGAIVGYATVVDVVEESEFFGNPKYAEYFDRDPALFETLGQSHVVLIEDAKRFKKPIPFKPKPGAIRIMKAPASFLKKATI